jgi:hypothetical protein
MNNMKATGLGEPEVIGKKSLFQPPKPTPNVTPTTPKRIASKATPKPEKPEEPTSRLRITTDLTKPAMETIQTLQQKHRLRTGKTLPAWKIISEAVEIYGKQRKYTTKTD